MALEQVKRVEYDSTKNVFIGDDGNGLRVEVHTAKTDFGVWETVDEFVIRHGGVLATINYLKSTEHAASV